MGDIFLEYIVKKVPDAKTALIKVAVVVGGVALTFLMLSFSFNQIMSMLMPAIFCGMCYAIYKLFTSLNVEFEYIVTNGEVDIDKIMAKRSRRRIFNAKPSEIELLAPLDEKYKNEYSNGSFAKTIDASSSKYAQNRWFLIANNSKHGRVRVIFEPTEKMVDNMKTFLPKKVMLP